MSWEQKGGTVTNSCVLDWHFGTSGMFSHGISQGIEEALMSSVIQEKNLGIKGQSRVFGVHLDRRHSQPSPWQLWTFPASPHPYPGQEIRDHVPKGREVGFFPS